MLTYALVIYSARNLRLRDDQSGDNLYYMGFLFTLTSLGVSLYQFSVERAAEEIVQNFGIAIASTITGIALRVVFNQMRRDPVEVERMMRLELAEAARRVGASSTARWWNLPITGDPPSRRRPTRSAILPRNLMRSSANSRAHWRTSPQSSRRRWKRRHASRATRWASSPRRSRQRLARARSSSAPRPIAWRSGCRQRPSSSTKSSPSSAHWRRPRAPSRQVSSH